MNLKPLRQGAIASLQGLLCVFFVFSLVAALHPSIRKRIYVWHHQGEREVLAVARGPVIHTELKSKIIKLRTHEGIFIEVYGGPQLHHLSLIDRFLLPDKKDGYFHVQTHLRFESRLHKEASNLALKDLNGDHVLEIIAPTFDNQLNARLNIYSYNKKAQKFVPYTGQIWRLQ